MKSLPRFAVAALLLAASAAGRAQTIGDLPEDKFKSLVEKTVLYIKALSAARIVQKSYDRYASWLDVKTGPTGKEKTVEGIPDMTGAVQEIRSEERRVGKEWR